MNLTALHLCLSLALLSQPNKEPDLQVVRYLWGDLQTTARMWYVISPEETYYRPNVRTDDYVFRYMFNRLRSEHLSLIDTPLPYERFLFTDIAPEAARTCWKRACAAVSQLEEDSKLYPSHKELYKQLIQEANFRKEFWNQVDWLFHPTSDISRIRRSLAILQTMMGLEDYYAGRIIFPTR